MRGDSSDTRRRLVVIGNGMAGARTVEEILARGGAEQFTITMFGDEPYGNYNRIMLSHVLSGEETDADIFLNSLPWYIENDITLHAGRAGHPDRPVRQAGLLRRRSDHAVRRADHRHRQPVVHAGRSRACAPTTASCCRASSRSARSTTPAG